MIIVAYIDKEGSDSSIVSTKQPTLDFTFMWPCIVTNFFIIKPTRCNNFTNLFCHETQHVSDSSSVHHQEIIHCTLSNGICHTSLYRAVYKPVWHIPLLSVQWINSWWWTDELSETCRVSWQNKICEISASSWFYCKEKTHVGLFWLQKQKTLLLITDWHSWD
jgi:hypothetical protein